MLCEKKKNIVINRFSTSFFLSPMYKILPNFKKCYDTFFFQPTLCNSFLLYYGYYKHEIDRSGTILFEELRK